ncbi:hypothetical protein, partial [Amycolatopsis tucumanensis]|uniref:hypothetical protein n=1 Tax=Amycolatopsis tucumanensis TaxID=401106 RepID=UPI001F2868DA
PARPARTLLIFKAALSREKRLTALERSPSDHPRPRCLIVFQSPSSRVKAGKSALTRLVGD